MENTSINVDDGNDDSAFASVISGHSEVSGGASGAPGGSGKKYARTTTKQQEIYVKFAKSNPEVLDNCAKGYGSKWGILAKDLNENGPERTAKEWQEKFKSWQYSLTHRMRNPDKEKPLKPVEKEALTLFGKIRVSGIEGAGTLGFENAVSGPRALSHGEPEPEPTTLIGEEDSVNPPKKRRTAAERMDLLVNLLEEQKGRDAELQKLEAEKLEIEKQRLKVDQQNANTWSKLSDLALAFIRGRNTDSSE